MHKKTLPNLSGLALVLAFGTSALAQDTIGDATVGATAGDSGKIVITDESTKIVSDVEGGAESRVASHHRSRSNKDIISGSGVIVDPDGNETSEVTISESGVRVLTVQELSVSVTSDIVISDVATPGSAFQTGNVTLEGFSPQGGMTTMTITTAPSNAIINNSVLTVHAPMGLP